MSDTTIASRPDPAVHFVGLTHDDQGAALTTEVGFRGCSAVIAVTGELDLASAPDLERRVRPFLVRPVDVVTLELRDLRFFDTSGVKVLETLRDAATEHHVGFVLAGVPRHVMRVLGLVGAVDRFTTAATTASRPIELD